MDGFQPIKPGSLSFAIAGAPSAGPGTVIFPGQTGEAAYLFDNTTNTSRAWIGYGMTSTAAQTNARQAALGGNSPAFPVAGGTVQTLTLNAGMFFSVAMEMGSGIVVGVAGVGS